MDTTSAKPQAAGKPQAGNPYNRRLAELRRTLLNFATQDDMTQAASALKELAMSGDVAAIQLLFKYVLGQPKQTVEPDQLELDECPQMQENTRPPKEAATVIQRPPMQTVETGTKATWPIAKERALQQPSWAGWWKPDARDVCRRQQTVEKPPSAKRLNRTRPRAKLIANGVNGSGP